ncbi:hypothetical protein [Bradyrhizobium betae]|uniref:Uncharacterized protein n=1 Tax=Bradyrhizobium betae TaxID=244734 RepID=A0A5P6NYM1_9BRAD|nr:hypothetical protein [Bradyrhizobium betae]MCS3725483.1 hypothetical protein [Bradyrhizobium betae]QFI71227.1 hypothetical protein F8237_01855 [Bradyrhizobium betae]
MSEVVDGHFAGASPQPGPHHVFGAPVSVPPSLELERHQQTERTCSVCGTVKVTVHAPDGRAWREWRRSASSAQIACDDLACVPQIGVKP